MNGVRARSRWNAVLFDLDGTLIDTRSGIRDALWAAIGEVTGDLGRTEQADLSLPLEAMIQSAQPAVSPADRRLLSEAFRRHYDSGHWMTAEVSPGAEECLRDLDASGVRTYVVTNKRRAVAARLLEHFALAPYLKGIVGQPDAGVPLPKAELARQCLESEGLDPAATVVVGDSDHDEAMAAAWAMPFIALTSGAGPLSHAPEGRERVEVDSLKDVARLVLAGAHGRKP